MRALLRTITVIALSVGLSGCVNIARSIYDAKPIGEVTSNSERLLSAPFKVTSLVIVYDKPNIDTVTKPVPLETSVATAQLESALNKRGVLAYRIEAAPNEFQNSLQGIAQVPSRSHILVFRIIRAKISEDLRTHSAVMKDATIKVDLYDAKSRIVVWQMKLQTTLGSFQRNPDFGTLIFQQMEKDELFQ